MIYYVPVKVMIDILGLAKVSINVIVHHHGIPESIMTDQRLFFISKFWFLLWYFLGIKRKLSIAFQSQTNSQTERQNITVEAFLRVFVNWKQNNWVRLLPMAEFGYNNTQNTSIGYTPFKLNCNYHLRVFFKENVDLRSKSLFTNKLEEELRKLIKICYQNLLHV